MMTRRERLERKAERRAEWAQSRKARASQHFSQASQIGSGIPMGQPVLVGHHSERGHRRDLDRIDSNMRRGVESSEMASHHTSKARNIERQLERTVFSDDDNAIEALEARIAEREAECDRIKAYNKSCKAAAKRGETHGDLSLLDESQKSDLLQTMKACPYQIREGGAFPAYALTNLRGRINADRKRLEQIKTQQQERQQADENGGVLVKHHGDYCSVTFAEKPERAILNELKAAGFRWSGGSWVGYTSRLPEVVTQ